MPKWSDFGNIWATMRELDVGAVREESEQPIAIVCIGHDAALAAIGRLLFRGNQRYPPPPGGSPLTSIALRDAQAQGAALARANLLIIGVDAREPLSPAEAESFSRLESLSVPFVVAHLYGDAAPQLPASIATRSIAIADPAALDAADALAEAVLDRLPQELHLAAARRLPGLRPIYCRELIAATSFTNATYALASGLPEQIPILGVPFAAADILVLTKNQAILVYRLALAHAAPPDFQARLRELVPVIGGAFLWRQAARSLIGLIPVWGLLPKIAIAYAGTYTTGIAAWRWYESGELVSSAQLKRISQESLALGRARAAELIARARELGGQAAGHARELGGQAAGHARDVRERAADTVRAGGGLWGAIGRRLPFRKKQRSLIDDV